MGEMRFTHNFLVRKDEEKDHYEDGSIGGRMLKQILK
jgi:hypothetical protein